MKFIKVLWFDLKNGYFKGVSCYIFPLFIAIIGFFELHEKNCDMGNRSGIRRLLDVFVWRNERIYTDYR